MNFPSKKDFWLSLLIWGTIVICTVPIFTEKEWAVLFIMFPIDIILIWFWFTTGYRLEGENLIIKYGPFKKIIPVMEITRIRATKNPLSAPALSIDRLEITYGRYDMALISPKEKQDFVWRLLEINSKIDVEFSLLNQ